MNTCFLPATGRDDDSGRHVVIISLSVVITAKNPTEPNPCVLWRTCTCTAGAHRPLSRGSRIAIQRREPCLFSNSGRRRYVLRLRQEIIVPSSQPNSTAQGVCLNSRPIASGDGGRLQAGGGTRAGHRICGAICLAFAPRATEPRATRGREIDGDRRRPARPSKSHHHLQRRRGRANIPSKSCSLDRIYPTSYSSSARATGRHCPSVPTRDVAFACAPASEAF